MKRWPQIWIVILAAVAVSCTDTRFYAGYVVRVDSLMASLEASATSFEQLDTAGISARYSRIRQDMDTLSGLFADSMDVAVIDYSRMQGSCKTILREYPLAIKALAYSRDQLSDLRHDIEHRHLEEVMVRTYFSQEKEAIALLKEKMALLSKMAEHQVALFDSLSPEIEMLIDSLSQLE